LRIYCGSFWVLVSIAGIGAFKSTGDVVSSEQDDKAFIRTFVGVMALLAVGTIIIFAIAMFAGTFDTGRDEARQEFERERLERRMQTVGVVRTDDDPMPVAMPEDDDEIVDDDEPRAADDIYASVCMVCHDPGIMDAARKGDGDAWQALLDDKGLDTLVENAISGVNGMPPRGGDSSLSDEEVRNTVIYILEESGVSVD